MSMTRTDWPHSEAFAGGCQCGRVRYRVAAGPAHHTVCHCRMCQRAVGNAFAPLIEVDSARVAWDGEPQVWASSSIAERGFCAACGTPLFYRSIGRDTVEFMAGTVTSGPGFRPVENHGMESRHAWLDALPGLPGRDTILAPGAVLTSHQWEPTE